MPGALHEVQCLNWLSVEHQSREPQTDYLNRGINVFLMMQNFTRQAIEKATKNDRTVRPL